MSYDAIVIGAGVNGLTAAAYLSGAGRRVLVLEQRAQVGGLCATEEFSPGFRANTCVDDPGWLPARVATELNLAHHGYAPTPSALGAVLPSARGVIALPPSSAPDGIAPRDAARWRDFYQFVYRNAEMLRALYELPAPDLHTTALRELLPMASLGRRMRGLGKRGMVDFLRVAPMPVADMLDEWFEDDGLKGALAWSGVLNVRHGPQSGGTALVFLHHHVGLPRGLVGGRRVVSGGVAALPRALAAVAASRGVDIRTHARVDHVIIRNGEVRGVVLASGDEIAAAHVLSSADVRTTFSRLVDAGAFDPAFLHAADSVRMRGPAVRLHLALDQLPPFGRNGASWQHDVLRGTVVLSPTMTALERAYDAAKHGGVAAAPALQLTIPSLGDPTLAPPGRHVMTVHAQFSAAEPTGGWTAERQGELYDTLLARVAAVVPSIRDHIVAAELLTQADIAERFGATEGSLLHGELALDQFLFMRPVPTAARYATPIPGLWLCGSSTHPGAGTACASGWLAARALLTAER